MVLVQALHFSVTAEVPLHLSGVIVIQFNACELSYCQVCSCCRPFSRNVRSDCIMKFNTSLTFTPPNTQPIGFGKIVCVSPSAQFWMEWISQTHVKFIPAIAFQFPSFVLSQTLYFMAEIPFHKKSCVFFCWTFKITLEVAHSLRDPNTFPCRDLPDRSMCTVRSFNNKWYSECRNSTGA